MMDKNPISSAPVPFYFGQEPFASIRGYMDTTRTTLTAGFGPAAGYIGDIYGTYKGVFAVPVACMAVSLADNIFLTPQQKRMVS